MLDITLHFIESSAMTCSFDSRLKPQEWKNITKSKAESDGPQSSGSLKGKSTKIGCSVQL